MDCPYIIRENIGFGRVREHGYYQLDEMAYDLTHDFANADVEVITRTLYNVTMESGEELSQLDDDTVFKMLSAGLPVKFIENARDGYIMYSRPESKPAVKVKRVSGITRASASRGVKQYDEPVVLPMVKEWLVVTALTELTMNSMQRRISKYAFLRSGTESRSMTKFVCITTDVSFVRLFWDTK